MLLTGFAFTSCSDVPEPYGINAGNLADEEEVIIEPAGSGTVADPYNVAGILKAVANLANGENTPTELVVKGIVCSIKEMNLSNGNCTFYISDNGKTTSDQFYVYRTKGLNGENFTREEQVQIGDVVVVQGLVTNYNGTIETAWDPKGLSAKLLSTTNTGGTTPTVDILGDVIFFEDALDGSLGDFTVNNVKLPGTSSYVWTGDEKNHCAKASGYVGGSCHDSEGWLICPLINLKKATEAYLTFDNYCNKFNVDASTQCAVLAKADDEQEWTALSVEEWPNGTFVTIANINLSQFVGKKVQIAFKYTSTTSSAGTWEIKNFKVTGFGEKGYNGTTWEDFTNGDFSGWDAAGVKPMGWQDDTSKGNATLSRSEDCLSQPYAVSIAGVALGERRMASQMMYFDPGTYTCTFSAKAATQAGARVQAGYWPQTASATIWDTESDPTGAPTTTTKRTDLTDSWQEISFTFVIEEGVPASLVIGVPTGSKDKAVLVDDVTLSKVQ